MLKIIAIILITILNILAADVVIASASETRWFFIQESVYGYLPKSVYLHAIYLTSSSRSWLENTSFN